ncbi:DUF4382 domain-containing protein [Planktosalinus lacus]|uniref:DUF4382 domain-containing protein n=1 Tax=Planktosalinus lacus TaxID=1526573 RepID=A0A8J2Y4U4_9FLAO|nr:DUF4382 domain-containing protein [Planktosalinus lacus]GGD81176.1 hypothetical protein GCM10011312_01890 [Planktosalinus lacus]
MKCILKISFLSILLFSFVACSDDDDSNADQASRIMVNLTDAPGDYEHVYVDVQDVRIIYGENGEEVTIGNINAGVYDLLELTGGVSVLLVDEEIPSGAITQMRLVLGEENSVVIDGETFPLQTPSAQQSGLKVQVNQTLEPGILYEFTLDFNVEESIVEQGNGGYLLKPVIRASTAAESGSISGLVLPLGVQSLVTASNNEGTVSAYTNAEGNFVLHGVSEGIYTVTIEPEFTSEFEIIVIENVEVVNGNVTSMGTIELL